MAAIKTTIASAQWVASEKATILDLLRQERDEIIYPAINNALWLNEHISAIFKTTRPETLQHFKTPAKLRTVKKPVVAPTHWIAPIEKPLEEIQLITTNKSVTRQEEPELSLKAPTPEPEPVVHISEPTPEASPVQLYSESDVASPSIHATPEKPLRKGSFAFASLPAREPLKQSLGHQAAEPHPTRQQSLGLDSDDSDDESVDLRAPELIAHEERMKAYESPSPPSPPAREPSLEPISEPVLQPAHEADLVFEQIPSLPGMYPNLDSLEEELVAVPSPPPRRTRSSARAVTEKEETITTNNATVSEALSETKNEQKEPVTLVTKPTITTKATAARETAMDRARMRAPKPLGRPVRPTNVTKTKPQPVAIKIKPLSHPKPVNTASVAAHNQESSHGGVNRPDLKKKTSAQSITSSSTTVFNKSTTSKPSAAMNAKVFSLAAKKKELNEQAASKDAAVKQQQKDRREVTTEDLHRTKREEDAEKDRKARENSAEKRKHHLIDLDDREVKRQKSEERQEREQAAADAKKAAFREMQAQRQIRPALKPATSTRPQNPPPRPPARLDLHEDTNDDTPPRLGGPIRQPSLQRQHPDGDLPAYPSNLSKPPVRVSNLSKKPSYQGFPQPPRAPQQVPQMQHFATQRIPFAATTPGNSHQIQQVIRANQPQFPSNNALWAPMQNMSTIAAINSTSPMSLPEIHTDSSDDSDRNVSLPSWATPGHVFNTLSQQETINPDQIFPRIPTISMDDVFAENPDRLRRLRMRTSSANWIRTGDALTQVEVIEDRIGRQAIRNAGGWVFGIGSASQQH